MLGSTPSIAVHNRHDSTVRQQVRTLQCPPQVRAQRSVRNLVALDSELPQISDNPVAPKTVQKRRTALGVLLLLSFLAVAVLAAPVWVGIVLGALMAFTAQPFYRTLSARLGGRKRTAALATTLLTGSSCMALGSASAYVLTTELFGVLAVLQRRLESATLAGLIGDHAASFVVRLGLNEAQIVRGIQVELGRATSYATQAAAVVLQTGVTTVVGLVIGCITMYYVLIEWPRFPVRLERVLPLDPRHTRALVLEFRDIGRSALIGTMATAIVQGVLATIGYVIFGLPHAVTWGLCTAVASFLPVAGTSLVWVPVSLYFASQGAILHATLQGVWGLFLVIGVGDYVLRPWLVGRRGKGQPLLILVAALGGMQVFGLAGIVVGPVMMSLFLAILTIYEREVDAERRSDTEPLFPPASNHSDSDLG
jgi:predicted PurR-regulated permease PerM